MAETVYILCALTCAACTTLLLRGYARSRARLLLWSGLCFAFLTLNNILLFVDMVMVPDTSLLLWRNLTGLAGVSLLVFGLIWDGE